MSMLPMMIASVIQSSVSIKRINKYMNLHELSEDRDVKKDNTNKNAPEHEVGTNCLGHPDCILT